MSHDHKDRSFFSPALFDILILFGLQSNNGAYKVHKKRIKRCYITAEGEKRRLAGRLDPQGRIEWEGYQKYIL